jgi:hypothetical protein
MAEVRELSGGEIRLWAEPSGSVMIKLLVNGSDPVELGEGEVDELIAILSDLRREIA